MSEAPLKDPAAVLHFYADAGVDECIGNDPVDRFRVPSQGTLRDAPAASSPRPAPPSPAAPSPTVTPQPTPGGASDHLAQACGTLAELKDTIESYNGCSSLKPFAKRTVVSDGNPAARVMLIGEAPGEDEDRQGLPFVGVSGKLLDKMLASIGLDRAKNAYITNIVFWRPPGNRKPTLEEVSLCMPFLRRQIEILNPAVIVLLGDPSTKAMLGTTQGITKTHGQWFSYSAPGLARPVPAIPMFHPAYLLRSPQQKRLAWRDWLLLKRKLDELGVA